MNFRSPGPFRGRFSELPKKHEQQNDDLHYLLEANSDFHCQLDHGYTLDVRWQACQLYRLALELTECCRRLARATIRGLLPLRWPPEQGITRHGFIKAGPGSQCCVFSPGAWATSGGKVLKISNK
jgi:hypothetical protein